MDQLKKIFAGAVKHQFWIITSVAALMACVAWFMTSSSLKKQYEENAKTIAEKFNAMQTVSSAVATHPNEHSITEMTKIIDGLASDVETAWSLQYKRQEQFLKWREEKLKMPLLISKLKRLYPIELKATYPDEPKNPLISNEEKRRFSQYFAEQMPELAKIIGVTWVGEAFSSAGGGGPGMGMGGMGAGGDAGYPGTGSGMGDMGSGGMGYPGTGMGGDMGGMGMGSSGMGGMGSGYGSGMGMMMGPQSNDVVIWSKASQSQLLTSLKMWQGDQPTVFQMMYTQENMWILEGIFNIIAKTNLVPATGKPATANFQATVKEIEFIRIGRDAVANAGSISGVGGGMGGMGMGGMGMGGMGMGDMGGMGMGMGDMGSPGGMSPDGGSYGGEGSASSGSGMGDAGGMGGYGMGMGMGGGFSVDPADRRYVDAAYKLTSRWRREFQSA
jgi:hypothetical protein